VGQTADPGRTLRNQVAGTGSVTFNNTTRRLRLP
jgi:hypothetical protein